MGRHVLLALETPWHTGKPSKQRARAEGLSVPGLRGAGTGEWGRQLIFFLNMFLNALTHYTKYTGIKKHVTWASLVVH